jgi:hypothetical protein
MLSTAECSVAVEEGMYFVLYATIVFILVLTKVLRVYGVWLIGILTFLMCWVDGSLIRVCSYNIKYGEVEEEFTRVSKWLKGGGILEKLLSTSIRIVSQRFGPIGETLGEIIADTIDDLKKARRNFSRNSQCYPKLLKSKGLLETGLLS